LIEFDFFQTLYAIHTTEVLWIISKLN